MDLNLKSKTAIITGGSHGIGKSIALFLANEGCKIYLCSRNKRYDIEDTIRQISDMGVECHGRVVDIAENEIADFLVAGVIEKFGKIDILINNVGGGSSWGNINEWELTPSSKWQEIFNQNIHSTVELTNAVLPSMIKNNFGRIISIASVYGKENGGMPWFQSAKSAQISFMKSYSSNPKYVKNNITFNTICPGFINMPDKQHIECLIDDIPSGRFGIPDDISPMVALLCSEKSSYVNGACITIDGGYTKSF